MPILLWSKHLIGNSCSGNSSSCCWHWILHINKQETQNINNVTCDIERWKRQKQTLDSVSNFRSEKKVLVLADLTSLGDPTPRSTKSPLWLSCLCKCENVPTDFDSTIPEPIYILDGSGTITVISLNKQQQNVNSIEDATKRKKTKSLIEQKSI